jgi:hypothetical protein
LGNHNLWVIVSDWIAMTSERWVIDVYQTEMGEKPVWAFADALTGRDRVEAFALIELLQEQGNTFAGHSPES